MAKYAFLFPGQGSQYSGMGKAMVDQYAAARRTFDEANDVLGFDLKELIFNGSSEQLTRTENTQPAILTVSVAAFRVFTEMFDIRPDYCAGHSLGEFSALTCAGAISFADALRIVRQRGKFMGEASGGAMAAVAGIDQDVIEQECRNCSRDGQSVVISNLNAPDQIVVSGHTEAIGRMRESLSARGGIVIPLRVSAPFHSPLMEPAAIRLKEELIKYSYTPMQYGVLSNVTAKPYERESSEEMIELLTEQMTSVVRWTESMRLLQEQGVTHAIELGPGMVLRNLMKKNAPGIITYSYDNEEDAAALQAVLQGAARKEEQPDNGLLLMTRCLAIAVCTRNGNEDQAAYTQGVVEPYRRVVKLVEECEESGRKPDKEQVRAAVDMLHSVFETKRTPQAEREERYCQLQEETGILELFLNDERRVPRTAVHQ
ncbi:ACP S-malonyltransferase [Paenibacillus oenotherae]|uniref:[acyl-carrier-protein] S-malonyltransferase n=1 Tax=Paenibacillus oenotherae TaxID=1435645 RepID=A0ABS7D2M0_9BACL|nr:ACP S-malonyltransferase [Paenibacillus oenotherae]MBW7474106.1 ACP S-malonyltransferase [Paenibacillus oenotherae]